MGAVASSSSPRSSLTLSLPTSSSGGSFWELVSTFPSDCEHVRVYRKLMTVFIMNYIDHVTFIGDIVDDLVESVPAPRCQIDCNHCISLKNTKFFIDLLMKEREVLLRHVQT